MNEIPEKLGSNSLLEQEIKVLTEEIEKRRHLLDEEKGVVVESTGKEEVVQALSTSGLAPVKNQAVESQNVSSGDNEHQSVIEGLVVLFRERGIRQALNEAKKQSPYVLDLFHDLLIDELYQELQKRGIVK